MCCIDGIATESFLKRFIVFQNRFLFPVLMFLKKMTFKFLNIGVTLIRMPLYFLQSSVDPNDFPLKS